VTYGLHFRIPFRLSSRTTFRPRTTDLLTADRLMLSSPASPTAVAPNLRIAKEHTAERARTTSRDLLALRKSSASIP